MKITSAQQAATIADRRPTPYPWPIYRAFVADLNRVLEITWGATSSPTIASGQAVPRPASCGSPAGFTG
jgi:hypothetical protein